MENILQVLLEEFRAALIKTTHSTLRGYKFPEAKNIAKVGVGIRRSGKTYFLFQTIRELISKNVSLDQVLYLNFEDDRLLPMDQKKMGDLIDALYTLQPSLHDKLCYLFLDEIQMLMDGLPLFDVY